MDLGFEGGFTVHRDCVNEKHNPDFIKGQAGKDHVLLQPTRFQTVFANDILPDGQKAWARYFSQKGYDPGIYRVESIVDLVKKHKEGKPVFPDKVDVVTGGFPCQDFSVAGKRNGFQSNRDHHGKTLQDTAPTIETRGQLYMWMKAVIDIVQPKVFIAENVKGLVNLSNVKEVIQQDFASANGNGYLVLPPRVLHAARYGVPQSRERVFFIGLKKEALEENIIQELEKESILPEYSPYPEPSHAMGPSANGFREAVKLGTIFKSIPEPELTDDPSQMHFSRAKFMGKHCQGQTEIKLNSIGPTIRSEHHGNIEFRRLSRENGGLQGNELNKGLRERRLTPRECALIQTFPPDFDFVVPDKGRRFHLSPSSAYKLIGNAVPPLLAYHLARRLEKLWGVYFTG
jgi:DNA (cytosine-5)-methyltransferase 1